MTSHNRMSMEDLVPDRTPQSVLRALEGQRQKPRAHIKGMQALGRLKAGQMNKTEAAYCDTLKLRMQAREILWYRFEGFKLRLADNTFYTPDFVVMLADGSLECHEVKGFWQDDARVKIKVAADQYPMRFIAVKVRAKKNGGGWEVEEF